jgi:hypothetical protein
LLGKDKIICIVLVFESTKWINRLIEKKKRKKKSIIMFSNFLESLYDGIGDDDAADDDEDNNNDEKTPKASTERHDFSRNAVRLSPEEEAQARGVKDDLTELGHTLTRQFRGVANFLAPLPDGSSSSSSDLSNHPRFNQSRSSDPGLNQSRSSDRDESCVGSDTPETGIRFRSWDLEEKLAEGNDPEDEEEEEEETDEEEEEEEEIAAVALTDEVLAFARNIAMHPETWLDFPLDPDEDLDGNVYIESSLSLLVFIDLTYRHIKSLIISTFI